MFVNDRKEKDSHPDRTGSLNVEGVEYWVSGWLKESKSGKKFLSISIKRKDEPKQQQTQKPPPAPQEQPRKPSGYGASRRPPADPDLDASDDDIQF